jgi:hypothetical protein
MAKNPEHRDLFPGALEILILQSLRLQPMHGYALVKHIKQVSDNLLQVEEGSLFGPAQPTSSAEDGQSIHKCFLGNRGSRHFVRPQSGRRQMHLR